MGGLGSQGRCSTVGRVELAEQVVPVMLAVLGNSCTSGTRSSSGTSSAGSTSSATLEAP